jgi:hypothetical protein
MNRPPSRRTVAKMREREQKVGLEPDDAAGQWLEEHEPAKPEPAPQAGHKSKLLHQFRRRQQ